MSALGRIKANCMVFQKGGGVPQPERKDNPIVLDDVNINGVVDKWITINDPIAKRNWQRVKDFQVAQPNNNPSDIDWTVGIDTANQVIGETGGDTLYSENSAIIQNKRAEYENAIKYYSISDGKFEADQSLYSHAVDGKKCIGGVTNFCKKAANVKFSGNIKPGEKYTDFEGVRRIFGENPAKDKEYTNRSQISNFDFETATNDNHTDYRQINYANSNKKIIYDSRKIDVERFKKEEPSYYQLLKDSNVSEDIMGTYSDIYEKYAINKEKPHLKFSSEKGNMYSPRIGDIVMFRNFEGPGRHAKIIKDIENPNSDNPTYVIIHNGGGDDLIVNKIPKDELFRMMAGEKSENLGGFDYVAIFTKDKFEGDDGKIYSEEEENKKAVHNLNKIKRAKSILGVENFKINDYSDTSVSLTGEFIKNNGSKVDKKKFGEKYNRYLSYLDDIPNEKLREYNDINTRDLENIFAIAAAIPFTESKGGRNLTYKGQVFLQTTLGGLTHKIAGNTSAGLGRINIRYLTEDEKDKYFTNSDNKDVKEFIKKRGWDSSNLTDTQMVKILIKVPEVNAEITLDKTVENYRRLRSNPNLFNKNKSNFWGYLALSHNTPFRQGDRKLSLEPDANKDNSQVTKDRAYADNVIRNAKGAITTKVKQQGGLIHKSFQKGGKYTKADVLKIAPRVGELKNPDGSVSTHLMAYGEADGKYYAYPTLFQDPDTDEWHKIEPQEAFAEAKRRGEIFEFNTEQEASNFVAGSWKEYQDGTKLPQEVFTGNFNKIVPIQKSSEEQERDNIRNYLLQYINSPNYIKRLENSGYTNPQQVVKDRSDMVSKTTLTKIQDKVPGMWEQLKMTLKGEPFSKRGNVYDKADNSVILDRGEAKFQGAPLSDIWTHELTHAEQNGTNLNDADRKKIQDRMLKTPYIYANPISPDEIKSDINVIRYHLFKDLNIDSSTKDIKKEDLKKLKDSAVKERLLEKVGEENLIWLLNNIAANGQRDIKVAQAGGTIKTPLQRIKSAFFSE